MDEKPEELQATNGLSLLIDLLNDGEFNILIDMNKPNAVACKGFALVLNLLERGQMYEIVFEKIKEILNEKDEKTNKILQKVFEYKKTIDENMDVPAVFPREVFKKPNIGVS